MGGASFQQKWLMLNSFLYIIMILDIADRDSVIAVNHDMMEEFCIKFNAKRYD